MKFGHFSHLRRWLAGLFAACCATGTGLASAQDAGLTLEATRLLKASLGYVAGLKQFSMETRSTLEVVLESGQKIQYDHVVSTTVQRPNRLRTARVGDLVDQVFYYDGKSVTLTNPLQGYYATLPAPSTLEAMLDVARESYGIVAPAGDFLYANAYDIMMDGVTSGFVVGKGMVEGKRCDHLAFRASHVDWQIWIEDGARPLPRKLVLTSRDVMNYPQFEVVVTKWDLNPKISNGLFAFVPPKGAKQVEFLPVATPIPSK